jgi:hypothetical protein
VRLGKPEYFTGGDGAQTLVGVGGKRLVRSVFGTGKLLPFDGDKLPVTEEVLLPVGLCILGAWRLD